MTTSASTPRIRLTQLLFTLVIAATALTGGRALSGAPGALAQFGGGLLVVAGTLWRLWASVFVAGRKDTEVVIDGPYAVCRHPLYLGSLLAVLGIGLFTRSVVLSGLLPLLFGIVFAFTIRREERYLEQRHGDVWRRYRETVPALWPRFSNARPLSSRMLNVTIYRKAFLDAASMLALLMIVMALDALREAGAWRTLAALP